MIPKFITCDFEKITLIIYNCFDISGVILNLKKNINRTEFLIAHSYTANENIIALTHDHMQFDTELDVILSKLEDHEKPFKFMDYGLSKKKDIPKEGKATYNTMEDGEITEID